jgi:bacterioferritin-associated ferredoxin
MIVCLCRNVSDRGIVAAVRSGVLSFGELRDELLVAMCCGYCEDSAREVFEAALLEQPTSATPQPGTARPA